VKNELREQRKSRELELKWGKKRGLTKEEERKDLEPLIPM
jgi:hypothetical protein